MAKKKEGKAKKEEKLTGIGPRSQMQECTFKAARRHKENNMWRSSIEDILPQGSGWIYETTPFGFHVEIENGEIVFVRTCDMILSPGRQ